MLNRELIQYLQIQTFKNYRIAFTVHKCVISGPTRQKSASQSPKIKVAMCARSVLCAASS
jgi:hypothetical protein